MFENTRKSFKSNLVLVVVLALESKGLYYTSMAMVWYFQEPLAMVEDVDITMGHTSPNKTIMSVNITVALQTPHYNGHSNNVDSS